MQTITPPCECGHTKPQHSIIFGQGECHGVSYQALTGASPRGGRLCHCVKYRTAAPPPTRIGWHERLGRLVKTLLQ
jgi:hypothetical protein